MEKGNIFLLGNVIQNVDQKIAGCVKYLGVDPSTVVLTRHRITPDFHYGEQKHFYIDLAFLPLKGGVAIEAIAPLEGDDNDYSRYLKNNGASGIHHVNVDSDLYRYGAVAEDNGAGRIIWNPDSSYVYFDTTELLGLKTEAADLTRFTPDPIPEPGPDAACVTGLGVVVRDLEKKTAFYQKLLGVERQDIQLEMGFAAQEIHNGREVVTRLNCAHVQVGSLLVELLEPLEEDSVFGRFLREKGEGVFYVGINCNQEEYARAMEQAGVGKSFESTDGNYICFETSELLGFRTVTVRR